MDFSWVEFFVGIAAFLGAALMCAAAGFAVTAVWWFVLGRIRKCAFETYLLADMRQWMKERNQKP